MDDTKFLADRRRFEARFTLIYFLVWLICVSLLLVFMAHLNTILYYALLLLLIALAPKYREVAPALRRLFRPERIEPDEKGR